MRIENYGEHMWRHAERAESTKHHQGRMPCSICARHVRVVRLKPGLASLCKRRIIDTDTGEVTGRNGGACRNPIDDQYQKRVLGVHFGAASRTMQIDVRFRDSFDNDDCPRVIIIIEKWMEEN